MRHHISEKGKLLWSQIQRLQCYAWNLCEIYDFTCCSENPKKHLPYQCEFSDNGIVSLYAKGVYNYYDVQQIPHSPVPTEVQMGSDEIHTAPSIPDEIPATRADEKAAEEMEAQDDIEAKNEIPQPAAPEIEIPEVVLQLTDTPQPKLKNEFFIPITYVSAEVE